MSAGVGGLAGKEEEEAVSLSFLGKQALETGCIQMVAPAQVGEEGCAGSRDMGVRVGIRSLGLFASPSSVLLGRLEGTSKATIDQV